VEAALSLAEAGARTVLCYRGTSFGRVADANQRRLESLRGRDLRVVLESEVRRIDARHVLLATPEGERQLDNDQVFVAIGGDLPTAFLERIGVRMALHHGERPARTPVPNGGAA
jgi:thioredoxin reductase